MLGPALDFGGEGITFGTAGMKYHWNSGCHGLCDGGVSGCGCYRLHDDCVDFLRNQIFYVSDLFFLVKTGIKNDQL